MPARQICLRDSLIFEYMPQKTLASYKAHLIWAFVILVLSFAVIAYFPKLREDAATWIGALSAFITFYAILFAILEARQARHAATSAKSAADLAKDAAKDVQQRLGSLATTKEITECIANIEIALDSLDANRLIPSITIGRIIELYSRLCHQQVKDQKSAEWGNVQMLVSYKMTATGRTSRTHSKTRDALLTIVGQLGSHEAGCRQAAGSVSPTGIQG